MFDLRKYRDLSRKVARRFVRDTIGSFVIQFAIVFVPLALMAGGSMDYVRLQNAKATAQAAADAAALAAAVALSDSQADVYAIAHRSVDVNIQRTIAHEGQLTDFSMDPEQNSVTVVVEGDLPTTFLSIINIHTLRYAASASALRRLDGAAEVALVLDNTWSMNGTNITALKSAASSLVDTLMMDPRADVKISVVPYADYVNVGVGNRDMPWVNVPPDRFIEVAGTCSTITSASSCNYGNPQTCYHQIDGISEGYTCYPDLQCTQVPLNPPLTMCSANYTRHQKWYGCVKSRFLGLHVTDAQPNVQYSGTIDDYQLCPTPILPLTNSGPAIKSAIQGMVVSIGGYRPETYIPSGLIWGLNVLSPQAPFTEARSYHSENANPRKALVLMTDGANTMHLETGSGLHVSTQNAAQIDRTYTDMQTLCDNIRANGIEIFTVAFAVGTTPAADRSRAALRSCASGDNYYFDAADAAGLNAAFERIAQDLATVRIVR